MPFGKARCSFIIDRALIEKHVIYKNLGFAGDVCNRRMMVMGGEQPARRC
jgi:hypothetical protein